MRDDVLVQEVLDKCDVLKQAGFWPAEPVIRPRAWLENFEEHDKGLAAFLLDKFTFYNQRSTDSLLIASYHSIGDGLSKGPSAPLAADLIESLKTAVFTLVTGEAPNPTDSGYTFCRKARQILNIPEGLASEPEEAIKHASEGKTVVFFDDFIGSGDQFIKTWNRTYGRTTPTSFADVHSKNNFTAIYITLVSTDFGISEIYRNAPNVAVCATHILGDKSSIQGIDMPASKRKDIYNFLEKYSKRLHPKEQYMAKNESYKVFGYKNRGLMFGFEHSTPDATLPIFWSPGADDWTPLVKRV